MTERVKNVSTSNLEKHLNIPYSTLQAPLWRKILKMSLNREIEYIDLGRPLYPVVVPFDHKVAEAAKQ